ncbi:hypothetical protein C1S65_11590 [Pseudomonas putida]|uniref:Uncharacterized protein n=1 Tax=Pseudomonas putida TaxID=303 RepID=A0AAD0L877_PSEPU|nr:hypothetical protein C1S65_11590 [Pseudomonas putida]
MLAAFLDVLCIPYRTVKPFTGMFTFAAHIITFGLITDVPAYTVRLTLIQSLIHRFTTAAQYDECNRHPLGNCDLHQ